MSSWEGRVRETGSFGLSGNQVVRENQQRKFDWGRNEVKTKPSECWKKEKHTLSIIRILASSLKLHSFFSIPRPCPSPFSITLQGPAYCIPVRADDPGPPLDQIPMGSVDGSEREGKNQKNRGELGR